MRIYLEVLGLMNPNFAKPASMGDTLQKQGNSYTNSPSTRNQQLLRVEPTSYLQSLDISNSSVPKKENAC